MSLCLEGPGDEVEAGGEGGRDDGGHGNYDLVAKEVSKDTCFAGYETYVITQNARKYFWDSNWRQGLQFQHIRTYLCIHHPMAWSMAWWVGDV